MSFIERHSVVPAECCTPEHHAAFVLMKTLAAYNLTEAVWAIAADQPSARYCAEYYHRIGRIGPDPGLTALEEA